MRSDHLRALYATADALRMPVTPRQAAGILGITVAQASTRIGHLLKEGPSLVPPIAVRWRRGESDRPKGAGGRVPRVYWIEVVPC
jgi:hypothetical protein